MKFEPTYSSQDLLTCYTAFRAAHYDEHITLTDAEIQRLLVFGLLTFPKPSEEDPTADSTYQLTEEGKKLAEAFHESLTKKTLSLEAQLHIAIDTLQLISQYGSTTLETEAGPISCNGDWCATQARWALNTILQK